MNEYLKYFETHTEYEAYINGDDVLLPNVSYCQDNYETHYTPYVATYISITISSAGGLIKITNIDKYELDSVFEKIEIDGEVIPFTEFSPGPSNGSYFYFDEVGQNGWVFGHDIVFTFIKNGEIPNSCFENCENIINIEIPDSVTSIGEWAFGGCVNLTGVTLPKNFDPSFIKNGAFQGCTSLSSDDSLLYIDNYVVGITQEKSPYTIKSGTTAICAGALYTYSSIINEIILPNTITFIGDNAFSGYSERTLTIQATVPPVIGFNILGDDVLGNEIHGMFNGSIYVPSESLELYKTANGWSDYAENIYAITQ